MDFPKNYVPLKRQSSSSSIESSSSDSPSSDSSSTPKPSSSSSSSKVEIQRAYATKPIKVTITHRKRAHAKQFSHVPEFEDLIKLAAKIKKKKVAYFYLKFGKEYRIRTTEDIDDLYEADVLSNLWALKIKFTF